MAAVHRTLGFLGILIIALHPVLILASYAKWGMGLSITMPMGLGFLALILLLAIAGSTFLSRIRGVHYDVWKRLYWFSFTASFSEEISTAPYGTYGSFSGGCIC